MLALAEGAWKIGIMTTCHLTQISQEVQRPAAPAAYPLHSLGSQPLPGVAQPSVLQQQDEPVAPPAAFEKVRLWLRAPASLHLLPRL